MPPRLHESCPVRSASGGGFNSLLTGYPVGKGKLRMTRLHAWERPHGGASRRLNAGRGALTLCLGLSVFSLSVLGAISAQAQQAPPPITGNEVGTLPPLAGATSPVPTAETPDEKPDAKTTPPAIVKPDAKTETPPAKTAPVKPKQPYEAVPVDYRLALGDTIRIDVIRHPELSTEAYILPDGNIVLPLINQMNVQGLTIKQVSDRVTNALRAELTAPRVMTRVTRRAPREASVLGSGLRSQGKRNLGDEYRLLQLISDSGGLAGDRPEFVNAVLFRKGEAIKVNIAKLLEGDSSQNLLLQDNDVFYATVLDPNKITVTVQGRVNRPGIVVYPKDGSLQTVMTQVGPPLPDAYLSRVNLLHADNTSQTLDMRDLLKTGEIKPDIKLTPGDTIIVPENRRRYAVLGAVSRPNEYMYPDDQKLTVLTALSMAGNLGSDADLKKAGIFRKGPDGKSIVIPVNLEKLGNPTAKPSTKTTKSKSSKSKTKTDASKTDETKTDNPADKTGADVAKSDGTTTDVAKTDAAKTDGTNSAKSGSSSVSKQVATIDTELLPDDQLVVPRKGTSNGFNIRDILSYVSAFGVLRSISR